VEDQISSIKSLFRSRFAGDPRIFRAPGRINLIGEHTDYNDGFVLPAAIDLQSVAACTIRDDRRFAVYAADKDEPAEFDLDSPVASEPGSWLSYVEGTVRTLEANNRIPSGANIAFSSTIPIGAGMSSSAALEIVIGYAILCLNQSVMDGLELAKAGQRAEHDYVGTRSGIMDQFASAFGRVGYAMLLDCRSLDVDYIPLDLPGVSVIVCDSGVHHELASSEYNRRREECEEAVDAFRKRDRHITHLRDVTLQHLEEFGRHLPPLVYKRARHVVTENGRTIKAAKALADQDVDLFGLLMLESHQSLRTDFDVSCRELDLLVDSAKEVDGVYGARMMGGGFGGSTINVVADRAKDRFYEAVSQNYFRATGADPAFYDVLSADSASEVI
jgi:galactokinase